MARNFTKRQPKPAMLGFHSECTALYIRVSTEQQADEGYSLDAQRARLAALCTANGWRLCDEHVYIDAGESGGSTARPAYQRMMAAIAEGAVNRVAVTKLDRLSRNTRDFLELLDFCDERKCSIVSIGESFDTGTPTGRAVVTVLMAFAQLERSQIKDRMMSGKQQKATQGGYNGAPTPYGYAYDGTPFHVDDAQAAIVKRIFTEFIGGAGLSEIASRLDSDNVPTAKGGKWAGATVRHIVRNGCYAGLAQWKGTETAGTFPPIISLELYESAVRRLQGLKPGKPARLTGA